MIDLVTVVFREELPILRAQAQSINLYFRNWHTRNIYIVVNDDDSIAKQIDPSWWGDFASLVRIIPRSLFSTTYVHNGWVSQQALKMMTAAISYSTWSMILDAKTILVKPFVELFDNNKCIKSGQLDIYPVFEPSRQIVNKLYNIDLPHQLGPGGVPFFVKNDLARLMISDIENQTKQSFPEWFQAQGMLTEFILYSGFVYQQFGCFDSIYNVVQCEIAPVNIAGYQIHEFRERFKLMSTANSVSVHRGAWAQLTPVQKQQYTDFLHSRGIQL